MAAHKHLLLFSLGLKGLNVIKRLHQLKPERHIRCVIARDRNMRNDYSAESVSYCEKNSIPFILYKGASLKHDHYDLALAVGWRWMIRDIRHGKLIVFHDSMLPEYRGFSPVVNALLNYEKKTGVTAFLPASESEYDAGNILAQKSISVAYPTKIAREMERIADLYADLAEELVTGMIGGALDANGIPQDESRATYSLWRDEEDYRIHWNMAASETSHFISCVGYPYKGASSMLNGRLVRILDAVEVGDKIIKNRDCGKVVFVKEKYPVVVCGQGLLMILDIRDDAGSDLLPLNSLRSRFQ